MYLHLHHFLSLPFFLTVLLVWVIASILPHITYMSHRTCFSPGMLSSVSLLPLHPFNIPHCWAAFPYIFPPLRDFESSKLSSLFELLLILWSLFNWLPLPAVCNFFLCLHCECFMSLQRDDVIYIFGLSRGVVENSGQCRHFPEVHFSIPLCSGNTSHPNEASRDTASHQKHSGRSLCSKSDVVPIQQPMSQFSPTSFGADSLQPAHQFSQI